VSPKYDVKRSILCSSCLIEKFEQVDDWRRHHFFLLWNTLIAISTRMSGTVDESSLVLSVLCANILTRANSWDTGPFGDFVCRHASLSESDMQHHGSFQCFFFFERMVVCDKGKLIRRFGLSSVLLHGVVVASDTHCSYAGIWQAWCFAVAVKTVGKSSVEGAKVSEEAMDGAKVSPR